MIGPSLARSILLANNNNDTPPPQRSGGDFFLYRVPCILGKELPDRPPDELRLRRLSPHRGNLSNHAEQVDLEQQQPHRFDDISVEDNDMVWWTEDLHAAYHAVVVLQGQRWQRAQRFLIALVVAMLVGFVLTAAVIAVTIDDDDELLATVLTIGWFPLYGLTVLANMVRTVLRNRWIEQGLQNNVVQACHNTWRHRQRRRKSCANPIRPRWPILQRSSKSLHRRKKRRQCDPDR